MCYTELILRPTEMSEQIMYSRDVRRMLAKALDGCTFAPELFGRGDDGKTLGRRVGHKPPVVPVVFGGGKGFFRLYGIGELGKEVLKKEMGTIVSAAVRATGSNMMVEIKEGTFQYKPAGRRNYKIGRLALGKRGKVRGNALLDLWAKAAANGSQESKWEALHAAEPIILKALDWYLAGTAEQLGVDLPRDLDMSVHGGELALSRIHPDTPGHVACIKNLQISMRGELYGPWSAGHLRGYGYGMLRREVEK